MIKYSQILLYFLDVVIILSPTIGYVDTMRIMIRTRQSDHYNINTILVIYFAQGTKVLFYIYHRYATRIFCQAIMLLLSATILTILKYFYCENKEKLQTEKENKLENQNEHRRESIDHILTHHKKRSIKSIFKIASSDSLIDFFISFLIYFIIIFSTFKLFYFEFGTRAVDCLGIISNLAEAATSFPTFVRVVIHQDALTTSPLLVLQYLFGDLLKIGVYSISKAPWSFFFGAFCQLFVDIITNMFFLRLFIKQSKKKKINSENSPLIDSVYAEKSIELDDEEEDLSKPTDRHK